MMMKKIILGVFTASVAVASLSVKADETEKAAKNGEIHAQTCLGCHGVKGYSNVYPTYQVPRIWGQRADYIISALKGYQNKDRSHPVMQAQAADWTETELKEIAAYFSTGAKVEAPAEIPEAIEEVATCGSCHGASGVSTQAKTPNLAGQNKSYIVHALKSYRQAIKGAPAYLGGVRAKGTSKTMKGQVNSMLKAVRKNNLKACEEQATAHHSGKAGVERCIEKILNAKFDAIAEYYSSLDGLKALRQ